MYEFPFGAGQQLNLNWIINEIITLHKQLDPDYELPNFDTAFPYMNLNTLNLDWILRELKAIKDLAPTEDATLLKMVANALIAETYDATTQYNVDDIVYRDNEKRLFKCIAATPAGGEAWDSNKWLEIDVGEVLTDLLVNGGTANAVTNVRYNDHKIQQEINGTYSDVITIEDTPTNVSDRLPSSKAVYNLNSAINHKLDVYTTTTLSGTGVPTDAEIISSIALNGEAKGEFVARFDLSNGNTAFTIIWTKISANYASGLGFGYYEESGYLLRKYQYSNGTLNTFDIYTSIIALQNGKQNTLTFDSTPTSGSLNPVTSGGVYTALNTPETITLNASTMTFPSGVSFHQASENTITKIGKICVLTYSIKMTNVTSTDALNITNFFPTGYKPIHIFKSGGETGLGDGKLQPILIDYTNSIFRIFPVNTGTTYAIGSITYICE